MAATGHLHPRNSSVKVVCGAGSIALTAHGNNVDIGTTGDQHEATTYGDTEHTNIDGLGVSDISYSGYWAGSGSTMNSAAACLQLLVTNGATCVPVFHYAPHGSAAASLNYCACVNVQGVTMAFPVDGIATMNATFTMRAGSLSQLSASWS